MARAFDNDLDILVPCLLGKLTQGNQLLDLGNIGSVRDTSGPAGVAMAFCTSLIRNLMGTGSLLAFPGSMAGAFLGAFLFRKTGRFVLAYAGEIIGTGIIGAMLCYPVAVLLMGKEIALFFYVVPFLTSTVCGTAMAVVLLEILRRSSLFSHLNRMIQG